jgi:hypothetical protein
MDKIAILLPVIALVTLTFGIALWMGKLRFLAVKRGDLSPRYYELNRGGKVPDYLARVSQNYDNLLELPILFYVVACLLYVTEKAELAQVIMAWLFVGSRCVHSYIHTTSNRVRHRMRAFLFGAFVLMAMWLLFVLRVLQKL